MTLFYQSGRVSRLSVGVPGFTEAGDLTLDVSGSLGIGTTQPRAEADVPNISIRGDIRDSSNQTGANGFYLSQDELGVRWRAGNPEVQAVINVQDDGEQIGFGTFDTLNFKGTDPFVVTVTEGDPNTQVAEILINPGFTKTQYGEGFGLVTSFGPDGTFWSIPGYEPGYGITGSVGFTSVGLGTNQPADDFQIGIGSTGVTINAALGRIRAQIIEADNIEVDGNLTVESLVVTPGIATLTDLEVVNDAIIPNAIIGFGSITESVTGIATINNLVSGGSTLGVGGEDTFVLGDLFVNGGIGSFSDDVFVGGDLEVRGEFTVGQLNAINAIISGIATINQIEGNVGVFTGLNVGLATVAQIGFNTGIGTQLSLVNLDVSGIATINNSELGVTTVGFASISDANIGIATVERVDVEVIDIEQAQVGILTVGIGLSVSGIATFVGIVTVTGDAFIDGSLTVTQQFNVKDLGAENLEVTGIGTIVELRSDVGIITSLFTEGIGNSGIITTRGLEAETLNAGVGTIASLFATDIDADFGRIGILTGNILDYNVGFVSSLVSGLATVGIITGDQLFYYDESFINGVTFLDNVLQINNNVNIDSGITTINTGPRGGAGFATFSNDVYVGNDLFVAGELSFEQLTGNNLFVTGIGTINDLRFAVGAGTYLDLEFLEVGLATIKNLKGTDADIEDINGDNLVIRNFADIRAIGARFINVAEDPLDPGSGSIVSPRLTVSDTATINDIVETGISQVEDQRVVKEIVGVSTIQFLTVTGIATIADVTFETAAGNVIGVNTINAGLGSFGSIQIGTDNSDEGTIINEDGIIADNGDFRDTLTANTGIITDLSAETANIDSAGITSANIDRELVGISTIGFADITDLNAGVATVGILTVTESFFSTGVSTFVGVTSIFGSAIVDGDLTVTGVTTFNQLDAEQSQIGILTVTTELDANGVINAEDVVIEQDLTVAGFSSFTGFATFTDAKFDEIETRILDVTEQANFENMFQSPTGIATLNVVGIKSALIDQTTIGVATVGFGSFTDLFAANANITGIITAKGEITIEGEVSITGIATIDQLEVTGIATIANEIVGFSSIGVGTITEADIEDLDVEYLRVGTYATFGQPGAANTTIGIMSVTGVSTFVGLVTTRGDMFVDGNLFVTGIQSIPQLNAKQSIIGILTVTDYVNINNLIQEPTGFSTFSDVSFNVGLGTTAYIGFASITDLEVTEDLIVKRNLLVNGITSLGSTDATTGFTTVIGDLYIGGDLFVQDDIFYDEIVGRNLFISGIATVNDLRASVGVITDLSGETLTYDDIVAISSVTTPELNATNIYAGLTSTNTLTSEDSAIGVATAISLNSGSVNVSGLTSTNSLLVSGTADIKDLNVLNNAEIDFNLLVKGNADIEGDLELLGAGSSITTPLLYVDQIEAEKILVGIQTVTERLDFSDSQSSLLTKDSSSVLVKKVEVPGSTTVEVYTFSSIDYSGFEFTVQSSIVATSDLQVAKIHGITNNAAIAFNQYSTVFLNEELALIDVVDSGNSTVSISIENLSPNVSIHDINITLTRSSLF